MYSNNSIYGGKKSMRRAFKDLTNLKVINDNGRMSSIKSTNDCFKDNDEKKGRRPKKQRQKSLKR